MRKPIYFLLILLFAASCSNNTHTEESTDPTSDSTIMAPPSSSMTDTTTTPGAGITSLEVIIEVADAKTGTGVTDALVTLKHDRGTVTFSPTDVAGKYFTMDDLSTLSGLNLSVTKAGYADFAQPVASSKELPTQVKITATGK